MCYFQATIFDKYPFETLFLTLLSDKLYAATLKGVKYLSHWCNLTSDPRAFWAGCSEVTNKQIWLKIVTIYGCNISTRVMNKSGCIDVK